MIPTVDLVVVNWNSGSALSECIASIERVVDDQFRLSRVVVVDNASADSSARGLEVNPGRLVVLFNSRNEGFARACNQGAAESTADFLAFVNSDTVLSDSSLSAPVALMESELGCDVGICGVRNVSTSGRTVPSIARFPSLRTVVNDVTGLSKVFPGAFPGHFLGLEKHWTSGPVDQVIGAFMIVRRSLFERLGGFDERFFLYFEDVDLAYRARSAACRSYYMASASVCHIGRVSAKQVPADSLAHFMYSRVQYFFKHVGRIEGTIVLLITLTLEPVARLVRALFPNAVFGRNDVLTAWKRLVRLLASNPASRRSQSLGPVR